MNRATQVCLGEIRCILVKHARIPVKSGTSIDAQGQITGYPKRDIIRGESCILSYAKAITTASIIRLCRRLCCCLGWCWIRVSCLGWWWRRLRRRLTCRLRGWCHLRITQVFLFNRIGPLELPLAGGIEVNHECFVLDTMPVIGVGRVGIDPCVANGLAIALKVSDCPYDRYLRIIAVPAMYIRIVRIARDEVCSLVFPVTRCGHIDTKVLRCFFETHRYIARCPGVGIALSDTIAVHI